MSGFSAEWLALRESHDLRARNSIVLDAVAVSFKSLDAHKRRRSRLRCRLHRPRTWPTLAGTADVGTSWTTTLAC